MGTQARLETVFTGDDAPFVAAINRAEKHAQGFQSRIQTLFQRGPETRAETSIGRFLGSLAGGDVQGAITGLGERLHGLGLAAGVGLGAAAIVILKATKQLEEARKAAENLNTELARPLSLQSALGSEGITKEIEATGKMMEALAEKRKGFFVQIQEGLAAIKPSAALAAKTGKYDAEGPTPEQKSQKEGGKREIDLLKARASAEEKIKDVQFDGLKVSEEQAEIEKIQLDISKKRAAVLLEGQKPGTIGPFAAANAIRRAQNISGEGALKIEGIQQGFEIKK